MATPTFSEEPKQPGISRNVLLAAAGVLIGIVLIVAIATIHRAAKEPSGPDTYAANVAISGLALSEATNGTGGKVTYIDGTVKNNGPKTLDGATVQLAFPADDGSLSKPITVPLTLVRTREPYVDLEPVSAEPLRAGQSHDFRLIVEDVPSNWNEQPPQIAVVRTRTE